MGPGSALVGATLQAAFERLRLGRVQEAYAILAPLAQAQPRVPDARYLLGLAREKLGDLAGAAEDYRAAVSLDKRKPIYHLALGDVLLLVDDLKPAERSLRAALALDRRFAPAAVSLDNLLAQAG
ncbi:MAG: tetratricopeptide repeat protein, partial [Caulobacteraceae bacterium]